MPRGYIAAALSMSVWLTASHTSAQTTRTEQINDEKAAKAVEVQPEAREKGDLFVTKLQNLFMPAPPALRLTLGDFRPAAGLAAGVSYVMPVGERGLWSTSTAWSIKNFKQVESAVDIRLLATDRIHVRPFVKWDDAPELPFFGLGTGSSRADEVSYGSLSAEAGGDVQARGGRWFTYGAGAGYLSVRASDGTGSAPSISSLATTSGAVAGIGSSPAWWHTTAYAAIGSRQSPGYTDSGGLYRIAFHDYVDRGGVFDFTRTEIDLRQFVPILHDNWIIALHARADLTSSANGQAVPFFMLPSIGGRDTLPGFADYRFTDRDSVLLRSELRWTPSPVVDMAIFLDQGTVAASAGALDLHDLKRGWGIGARLHGPTFTALRLEVAHSIEGWRYNVAHNISF
jgi:surface antigen Omp85-like protein